MASLTYRQWVGSLAVAALTFGLPGVGLLAGGCDEDTPDDGTDPTLPGVNEVPSPSMSDDVGPGSGGFGTGGAGGGTAGQPCANASICDDFDPCTANTCEDMVCVTRDVADDGNECTTDTCDADGNVTNTPVVVNDLNECTFDSCDPATGLKNLTAVPIFAENFSSNAQGWALGPQWAIGAAAASDMGLNGGNDPSSDHTTSGADGVAGTALGANIATQNTASFLTSPPIPLTTVQATGEFVTLRFWRWLNMEAPPDGTATVEVFNCNTSAFDLPPIWSSGEEVIDAPPTGTGWFEIRLDITAEVLACLASGNIRVRFGFTKTTPSTDSMGGWNIDDLDIVRVKTQADDLICTDDGCMTVAGPPPAPQGTHLDINIMDEDPNTTFSCSELSGPAQR